MRPSLSRNIHGLRKGHEMLGRMAPDRAIAHLEIARNLGKPGYTVGAFGCASPQSGTSPDSSR